MRNSISYSFKCWFTCILLGFIGVLAFDYLKGVLHSEDILFIFFFSALCTTPLVFFFTAFVSMLSNKGFSVFRFRTIISICCVIIWLAILWLSDDTGNLIIAIITKPSFLPYIIGLLIGIWTFKIESDMQIEIPEEFTDILDVDI